MFLPISMIGMLALSPVGRNGIQAMKRPGYLDDDGCGEWELVGASSGYEIHAAQSLNYGARPVKFDLQSL